MSRLCILFCMTVMGWVGWWIGAKFGLTAAFVISSIGSIAGIYLGWRIYNDYLG